MCCLNRRDEGYYKGSPWKGKVSTEGGGALINQSIHTLDLLLRYLGEPIQLKASIANHHTMNHIDRPLPFRYVDFMGECGMTLHDQFVAVNREVVHLLNTIRGIIW